jgi:CHAT domain-containing protein
VIVADGVLGEVPFAALLDSRRDRYLVQDRPLRVVPSLRAAGGAPRARQAETPLFIADPAFDVARNPGLERLPGAEREVSGSAALYDGARVLRGREATGARTRRLLPGASLVHFAGHALYDPARPERSRLMLASDSAGTDGWLTADELSRMDLRRAALVVLSACETMRASSGGSAAIDGFAPALLAAGAEGVLGTLWRVEDRATSAMMHAFHTRYRASRDATTALREAQLEMMASHDPALRSPAAWAAFRYAGR